MKDYSVSSRRGAGTKGIIAALLVGAAVGVGAYLFSVSRKAPEQGDAVQSSAAGGSVPVPIEGATSDVSASSQPKKTGRSFWHLTLRNDEIGPWVDRGGDFLGTTPTLTTWGPNRIDIFARGQDNQLWHRYVKDGNWDDWQPRGGLLASDPSCTAFGRGRFDCFYRGEDSHIWWNFYKAPFWDKTWKDLGGNITSAPSAMKWWGSEDIDVFGRGPEGHMWHLSMRSGEWLEWEDLGGELISAPSCISWGEERMDCFYRGKDNHLWWKMARFPGGKWTDWSDLGGDLASDPNAVLNNEPGGISVFVKGMNNHLQVIEFHEGNWGTWEDLGGNLVGAPGCVSREADMMECFALKDDPN